MSLCVYYLDDEEPLCNLVFEYLTAKGVNIKTFTDATKVIEACNKNKPDLIFIDYRLNDTTGDAVANKLSPEIPKILVTGELNQPSLHQFHHTLSKPFKLFDVESLVNHYK